MGREAPFTRPAEGFAQSALRDPDAGFHGGDRMHIGVEVTDIETLGGLEMLVAQAVKQFEWWTGQPAPVEVMAQAAQAFLDETSTS